MLEFFATIGLSIGEAIATFPAVPSCLNPVTCVAVGVPLLLSEAGEIVAQNGLYAAAADPSLPNYTQIVQPAPFTLLNGTQFVNLPVVQSLNNSQMLVMQTFAAELSSQNATSVSISRYNGAIDAGDYTDAGRQLKAITSYASDRDGNLSALENQFTFLTSQTPPLNSTIVQYVNDTLHTQGLPNIEKQVLNETGFSSSVENITLGLTMFNSTSLNGLSLAGSIGLWASLSAAETDAWRSLSQSPYTLAEFNLTVGWNLISTPLVPVNPSITTVLAGPIAAGHVKVVWGYSTATRTWSYYAPGPPASGSLASMADGNGYWVDMNSPDELYINGTIIPPTQIPPMYSLATGWNLLGFKPQPTVQDETAASYLSNISGNYETNSVWVYNNTDQEWIRADPAYILTPGQGIWIYITKSTTLAP